MRDRPTIASRTFRLGPWMKHRTDEHAAMWQSSPTAPHKLVDWLPFGDPVNQCGVVWRDADHRVPERVVDGDGCTAVVWGQPVAEEPA